MESRRTLGYVGMQMRLERCLVFLWILFTVWEFLVSYEWFPQTGDKGGKAVKCWGTCCGKTFKKSSLERMQNKLCSQWSDEKSRSFNVLVVTFYFSLSVLQTHVGFQSVSICNQTGARLQVNGQWSLSTSIMLKREFSPAHVTLCKWFVFYFERTLFIIQSSLRKKETNEIRIFSLELLASIFIATLMSKIEKSRLQVPFKVHVQYSLCLDMYVL